MNKNVLDRKQLVREREIKRGWFSLLASPPTLSTK
jgi:hypothetical protein